ncbi:unnamed protein product, partial [Staurois parvus]
MIGADPRSDNCRFSAVLSSRSDSGPDNQCPNDGCPAVPPTSSAHLCPLVPPNCAQKCRPPVPISATHLCPSVPTSATSQCRPTMPSSCASQCPAVCHLSVPTIS